MPGPRFFSLAFRIAAYPGVVQVLVRQRAAAQQERARPVAAGRPVSLSEWALSHPDAMVSAAKQWKG